MNRAERYARRMEKVKAAEQVAEKNRKETQARAPEFKVFRPATRYYHPGLKTIASVQEDGSMYLYRNQDTPATLPPGEALGLMLWIAAHYLDPDRLPATLDSKLPEQKPDDASSSADA